MGWTVFKTGPSNWKAKKTHFFRSKGQTKFWVSKDYYSKERATYKSQELTQKSSNLIRNPPEYIFNIVIDTSKN